MRKVTRSSLKALQTTLPFGSKQLIFSNRNSSLNNYSTSLKKGNYPAPLTNNNKTMKNLFAVKYYSTSTLLADKNTTPTLDPTPPTTTTLDPTLFENWTKEEVCSLLCSAKGKGGAGLTVEEAKSFYDAGFKGTSVANIVTTIKDKDKYFAVKQVKTNRDYQSISQTTLESVVNWVHNLLKTRLYHLLPKEQVREELIVRHAIEVTLVDFNLLTLKYHGFEKLDAFLMKFEDFGKGSWLFSSLEKKNIFSNVKEIKRACSDFIMVENSTIRGRPSVEVLGQVRTGKTITARYILPHALADTINKDRMKNNRPKLRMAPTFYIRFDESSNPLATLYQTLKPLRNAIGVQDTPNPTIVDITTTYTDFQTKFPDVYIFIVLDEVQLLQPAHLNVFREFAKNRSYSNVTFILTGSTQSRFISVLDKATKNGLSYDQGTITYIVPTDNNQDMIDDTYQFHMKLFTENEILFIRDTFGCVNCATISQIIEIMQFGSDFTSAVDKVVQGIYGIFDRDVLPYFKDMKLDPEMVSFISHGIFTDRLVTDQFFCEYIKYFVDPQNSQFKIYSFRDKLLKTYLQQRLIQIDGYFIISQSYPYQISSHYIIMYYLFEFGERINQCKNKYQYPTTAAEIHTFWATNNEINNLTDSDVDYMYNQVYQLNANTQNNRKMPSHNKLPANSIKGVKLEEIFILIRHIYSHTTDNNASSIKQVHDEMLNCWFKGNRNKFSTFLRELHVLCDNPLT